MNSTPQFTELNAQQPAKKKQSIFLRISPAIVLLLLAFCVWYSVAANYGYSALAGTYVFHTNEETCTLLLRSDSTFTQELNRSGEIQKSQGHWYRYGEAHVSFSSEFLKVFGQEANASGQAHGEFEKRLGVFPVLVLAPLPEGPRFHRKVIS